AKATMCCSPLLRTVPLLRNASGVYASWMQSSNTSRCGRMRKSADWKKFAVTGRNAPHAEVRVRAPLPVNLQKRLCNEISEGKTSGGSKTVLSPEKGLQVLCRKD